MRIYGQVYQVRNLVNDAMLVKVEGSGSDAVLTTHLTYGDGRTTMLKITPVGNITNRVDTLGRVNRATYNSSGFLASETDPLTHTTSYVRDSQGRGTTQCQVWTLDIVGWLRGIGFAVSRLSI
jgi:YD repeat-containing protein